MEYREDSVSSRSNVEQEGKQELKQEEKQEGKQGNGYSFLTEAFVEYMLLPADCEEITALRRFRNEYVRKLPNGGALLKEHDRTALQIINIVRLLGIRPRYFIYIYLTIMGCVNKINDNENERALAVYIEMMRYLKRVFNIIN
ncbi:MAG: hypothetical protein J1G38_02320 [Clostridiales bacterium]|nr:hypothetical protein [Clostridiales bacterium]